MLSIVLYILLGLFAGILSGLFGIGGGIIIIPALIYVCGFSQLKAQGTSLMVLLPPVGILALLEYYKRAEVDIKAGIIICVMLFIGAALGGRFVQYIPVGLLRKGFAILMLLLSIKMLLEKTS